MGLSQSSSVEVAVLLERTFQNHELSVCSADTSVSGFVPCPGSGAPGPAGLVLVPQEDVVSARTHLLWGGSLLRPARQLSVWPVASLLPSDLVAWMWRLSDGTTVFMGCVWIL